MGYQLHPIQEIEGIGLSRRESLKVLNIYNTEDLLVHDDTYLKGALSKVNGFPVAKVDEFKAHAELMQIEGLNGQFAEALYRAKRRSLFELSGPKPGEIVRIFNDAKNEGIIPESIDEDTVTRWQKRALFMALTGSVSGTVSSDASPLSNAKVICKFEEALTSDRGKFWLPVVHYGKNTLIVRADGFKSLKTHIHVSPGNPVKIELKLTPGADEIKTFDEAKGQPMPSIDVGDRLLFKDIELSELQDETPLIFNYLYKNGNIRLMGVFRKRVGHEIEVPRIKASGDFIDSNARLGDIFIWKDNELKKSEYDLKHYRRQILIDHFKKFGLKVSFRSKF